MADKTAIELSEEAQKILRDLEALPETMPKAIAEAMHDENRFTISHIQSKYLSFSRSGPPVEIGLRVKSGRLRGAVWAPRPEINGEEVSTSIGNNVEYAAIHEFGGTIHIGERKGTVRLRVNAAGELIRQPGRRGAIFARADHKRVREVGYTAGAHDIEMPARAPIQRGIEDRLSDYGQAVANAVVEAMMGGER